MILTFVRVGGELRVESDEPAASSLLASVATRIAPRMGDRERARFRVRVRKAKPVPGGEPGDVADVPDELEVGDEVPE